MEALVYLGGNYWDSYTDKEKEAYSKDKQLEMIGRPKRGDVVEIQEDGYFDGKNYGKEHFRIVKKPGEKKYYTDLMENNSFEQDSKIYTIFRKRKIDDVDAIVAKVAADWSDEISIVSTKVLSG